MTNIQNHSGTSATFDSSSEQIQSATKEGEKVKIRRTKSCHLNSVMVNKSKD